MIIITFFNDDTDEEDRLVYQDEGEAIAALRVAYGHIIDPDSDDLDDIASDIMLAYPNIEVTTIDMGDDPMEEELL